ncbi:MAG: hypothetical protein HN790_03985 [Methylococcales bacterium]|nr:hypothetical protein [Methylococcales bacterium]
MKKHIIAHRGFAHLYPENSLLAITKALKLGIRFIEVDIQFCQDNIPVVLHDLSLSRTANQPINITQTSWQVAQKADLGAQQTLPSYEQLISLIKQWPDCFFFIELKEESLEQLDQNQLLNIISTLSHPIESQISFICYDPKILTTLRQLSPNVPSGLILRKWDNTCLQQIERLKPEYVICNYQKIPQDITQLPYPNSQWAFYEVTDTKTAQHLLDLGASLIETMNPPSLLPTPCND